MPHRLCTEGLCDHCTPEEARQAREAWAMIEADRRKPREPTPIRVLYQGTKPPIYLYDPEDLYDPEEQASATEAGPAPAPDSQPGDR
jgi:hypothetical protein